MDLTKEILQNSPKFSNLLMKVTKVMKLTFLYLAVINLIKQKYMPPTTTCRLLKRNAYDHTVNTAELF